MGDSAKHGFYPAGSLNDGTGYPGAPWPGSAPPDTEKGRALQAILCRRNPGAARLL